MMRNVEWGWEGTELAWVDAGSSWFGAGGEGAYLSNLVPCGFDAHLRVFHRAEAGDGSGRSRTWGEAAELVGATMHAEVMRDSVWPPGPDGETEPWHLQDGTPDALTRAALVRVLGRFTGGKPVTFAWDSAARITAAFEEPAVLKAPLEELEKVRAFMNDRFRIDSGPEFWWPEGRGWFVASDYDLYSTYLGCPQEIADAILAEPDIEALPIRKHDRIDWSADTVNLSLWRVPERVRRAGGVGKEAHDGSDVEARGRAVTERVRRRKAEWRAPREVMAWMWEWDSPPRPVEAEPPGVRVLSLLPKGFESCLRIFHQEENETGDVRRDTWRTRAEQIGAEFHAEISQYSLWSPEDNMKKDSWFIRDGNPDSGTRAALLRVLIEHSGDQPAYYFYDLPALLHGHDPFHQTGLLSDLEKVRAEVDAEFDISTGPETWWPQDRSWVVVSDYDLIATYVACSRDLAAAILAAPDIEALPVQLDTRVDWSADDINPSLWRDFGKDS